MKERWDVRSVPRSTPLSKPSRERCVAALTARGGRRGTGYDVALSVSLCGLKRATIQSVTFFSSETSIRREIPAGNLPKLANRAYPKLCRRRGIACLSLSIDRAGVIRFAKCGHRSCPAGAEIVERVGQIALPGSFPLAIGRHKAFTPSGAFEISRPPLPRRLRMPSPKISLLARRKTASWGVHAPPVPPGSMSQRDKNQSRRAHHALHQRSADFRKSSARSLYQESGVTRPRRHMNPRTGSTWPHGVRPHQVRQIPQKGDPVLFRANCAPRICG